MSTLSANSLISLGNRKVSRFIIGHNPPCGNSHFSKEIDREMEDYFTADNVLKLYRQAEELGLRTAMIRGDYRMLNWVELYRRKGGAMNIISQTASEMHDIFVNIRVLAAAGIEGIYFHGSRTDRMWREGQIDQVNDYLKCMRDCGVAVGLGTHQPEIIEYSESKGWDVDFYMACLYNISRKPRESQLVKKDPNAVKKEEYLPEDRAKMLATIRATSKPCLAFKILAASRLCQTQQSVREAIIDAYGNIKLTDACVVGIFPKNEDQLVLDLGYAEEGCRTAEDQLRTAAK
jgi:hypothetical protein